MEEKGLLCSIFYGVKSIFSNPRQSHNVWDADQLIKVILDDAHYAGSEASCRKLASAGTNVKVNEWKICDRLPGTDGSLKTGQYNWRLWSRIDPQLVNRASIAQTRIGNLCDRVGVREEETGVWVDMERWLYGYMLALKSLRTPDL